jgi:hypothetical protein
LGTSGGPASTDDDKSKALRRQLGQVVARTGGMKLLMFLGAMVSFVAGCVPDPSSAERPAEAGVPAERPPDAGRRGVDSSAPLGDACAARVGQRPPSTGFAVHATTGEIVAFEPDTGRELARHPLGFEILDLEWDGRTRRLLAVGAERFDLEGSRVHALSFEAGVFVHEASSEVFAGELRVISTPERLIAVGGELAPEWHELDRELAVVGTTGALPRPQAVAEPDAWSLFALRREPAADVVYRVSGFSAGWASQELALPRLAPERAVAIAANAEQLWLVRFAQSGDRLELAALDAATFAPDSALAFREVSLDCAPRSPRAVGLAKCALVSVVGAPPAIALLPLSSDAASSCRALNAPLARSELWLGKNLMVAAASGRAWVATEQGVEGFRLEPAVRALENFSGSELRAPLALAK